METNEKILEELKEIKDILKQILEAQIQTNDNIVTFGEEAFGLLTDEDD